MAKSTIAEFLVKVASVGLNTTKKNIDDLGKSTQDLGRSNNIAERAARMHYDTQSKGIIGTANSTKSFSKLAQTIGSGSSGVVGAYATLAANVFAVTAAFNALRAAAQFQQVEKGLEALGARTGQTLTVAAKGLREVTGETISLEQAMRSSAQVFSAGFGSNDLERIGKVANDASVALGRNMTDSMDRLTRGVIKLEPELLDELGIMTKLGDATQIYARELNKSESALSAAERRQAFLNAVLAEGELKFGGLSSAAGNTRGYDSLAAAMSDASKNTLNFLNVGLLPVVNMLSTSPTALVGGALLFASTIKDQLLPGMANIAEKSEKMAQNFKKMEKAEIDDVITGNKGFGNHAAVDDLAAKIEAGKAGLNDYKIAQTEVGKSIEKTSNEMQKYEKRLDAGGKTTKAHTAIYNTNKEALSGLVAQHRELAEVVIVSQRADAEVLKSQALIASSMGENGKARKLAGQSILSYAEATRAAAGPASALSNTLVATKTAGFAASIGIKAAGAAILTALPWIGLAVTAVGLLIAAYKSLQSEQQKLDAKLGKEFGEIFSSLGDKLKELQKINESNASASARTLAAIKLESNAIVEMADKYKELRDARATENKDKGTNNGVAKWWNAWSADDSNSLSSGVRRDTIKTYAASRATIPELQALETMKKTAPEALDEIVRLNGGLKAFKNMKAADQATAIADGLDAVAAKAREAGAAVAAFETANKTAGDALTDFVKSATPKTSFDTTAQELGNLNRAIRGIGSSAAISTKEYADLLSGLSEGVKGNLSLEGAKFVSDTQTVNDLLQTRINQNGVLNQTQAADLATAQSRLQTSKYTVSSLVMETAQMQEAFETARAQERIIKSQNNLISAQIKANQGNAAITVSGLKTQMDLENQIINNNIAQLEVQRSILSGQAEQAKAKVRQLELEREHIKLTYEKNQAELQGYIAGYAFIRDAAKRETESKPENTRYATAYAEAERNHSLAIKQLFDNSFTQASSIKNIEEGILTARQKSEEASAASAAITNEIATASLGILSTEQIAARLRERAVEINNANAEKYESILAIVNEIEDVNNSIAAVNRSQDKSLAFQITAGRTRTTVAKDALKAERDRQISENRAAYAKAAADRGDMASRKEAMDLFDFRLKQINSETNAKIMLADRQQVLNELESVMFDTRKEGLEWQKQSLDYLSKQLEVSNQLKTATNDRNKAEESLRRKRYGYQDSEINTQTEQIKAAELAYNLAVSEAGIKKALIDLEYALLDAQRAQLADDLKTRRAILAADTSGADYSTNIAQLDRVLVTISNIDVGAIAEAAKAAVDENLKTMQIGVTTALTVAGKATNSVFDDLARRREARASAERSAAQAIPDNISKMVEGKIAPQLDPLVIANDNLSTSLDDLKTSVDELKVVIMPNSSSSAVSLGTVSAQQRTTNAGRDLQAQGLRVSEAPGFGGVTEGVHSGRGHAEGRAIDVNIGKGNTEWNNPAQKAIFDALDKKYTELGATVLWGPMERHINHMHIEFKTAAQAFAAATAIAVETAGTELVTQIEDVAPVVASRGQRLTGANVNTQLGDVTSRIPNIGEAPEKVTASLQDYLDIMTSVNAIGADFRKGFEDLGPQGAMVIAAMEGISSMGGALQNLKNIMADDGTPATTGEKFKAMAEVASAALATVQAVYAQSSAAKIAGVDAEIAAEQKRDGKSAESVAKLQSLERKKDSIARKSFEVNKKIMMAQAIMATAAGIAGALGSPPFGIPAMIMAGIVGAMGAAQLAIISGTSYQSTSAPSTQTATIPNLSIGKRGDSVDLAKNNPNAGGEIGYLRGAQGRGNNSSNYSVIGSAYGGKLNRGYGNAAYIVGEHGPEVMTPDSPMSIRPMADTESARGPTSVQFNVQALDAKGVEEILMGQRGNIIGMLREAANANGQTFLEDVNTNVYTKPNVGRL